jgi:hypothetical protein
MPTVAPALNPPFAVQILNASLQSSSGVSGDFDLSPFQTLQLVCFASTSVAPTSLIITVEQKDASTNGNYYTTDQLTTITSTPNFTAKSIIVTGLTGRFRWAIVGTSFTFDLSAWGILRSGTSR